tara:strand:+ start:643 stop:912 length:270 start_codon:yes stop_codon:yes gene_type:complete
MGLRSYKSLLRQQMEQEDYKEFTGFKQLSFGFTDKDLEIVYRLHAKYFVHTYNEPCGCGGVKKMDTINKWIADLQKVYDNGVQTKKLSE